jgi:hypothetical protein
MSVKDVCRRSALEGTLETGVGRRGAPLPPFGSYSAAAPAISAHACPAPSQNVDGVSNVTVDFVLRDDVSRSCIHDTNARTKVADLRDEQHNRGGNDNEEHTNPERRVYSDEV